jgi:hypothetical protein
VACLRVAISAKAGYEGPDRDETREIADCDFALIPKLFISWVELRKRNRLTSFKHFNISKLAKQSGKNLDISQLKTPAGQLTLISAECFT